MILQKTKQESFCACIIILEKKINNQKVKYTMCHMVISDRKKNKARYEEGFCYFIYGGQLH